MTTMNITIVANDKKSATAKTGKAYQLYEVAYRNNSFEDKLESTKINQYSSVFSKVAGMKPGEAYIINKEKNEGGFWQWEDVTQLPPGEGHVAGSINSAAPTKIAANASFPTKSTYETPEERAKKQVYIVKQSSISNAIAMLSVGSKTAPTVDAVIAAAQQFTDWVFSTISPQPAEKLADMSDDIPS